MREFLWGIGRKWIEFGIDGWRLDVPNEIDDDDFWREFRRRVRAVNPEAYIVGEVWTDAPRWLQGDMWDAVMNYQFTRACIAFFIGESVNDDDLTQDEPPSGRARRRPRRSAERSSGCSACIIPNVTAVMLNLLGSHDMARFLTLAQRRQVGAAAGDAVPDDLSRAPRRSTTATRSAWPAATTRPTAGAFPWHKTETWDTDLLHEFQRLIALRRARPALRRGSFRFLHAQDDVIAYVRQLGDETVVVAINAGASRSAGSTSRLAGLLPDGAILERGWSNRTVRAGAGDAPRRRAEAAVGRRPGDAGPATA